jgi:hypothetical protein
MLLSERCQQSSLMGLAVAIILLPFFGARSTTGDALVTCQGEVVTGSSVFQNVKGRLTKLRVEGRVGDCPFSTSGKYKSAGDTILRVCGETTRCKVLAIVGQVPGTVISPSGMSGCCALWIKEVQEIGIE